MGNAAAAMDGQFFSKHFLGEFEISSCGLGEVMVSGALGLGLHDFS